MLQYAYQTHKSYGPSCQRACSSRSLGEPGCANSQVFYLPRYLIFMLVAMVIARYFIPLLLRSSYCVFVVMTTFLRLPEHILLS